MICLKCVQNKGGEVCRYCGECAHLCKTACGTIKRIKKQDALDSERRKRPLIVDEPQKKGVYVAKAHEGSLRTYYPKA